MSVPHQLQFSKEKTALKFFLIGRGYSTALKALGFAERYHVGLRKDGFTPEFHHQIRIALAVTQLKSEINEELCIILALLHDVQEDYQIPYEVLVTEFSEEIARKVWKLTKKFQGELKNQVEYIEQIAIDPDCSIVKGLDRCDNLESMVGVFDLKKMEAYGKEAFNVFLKMLRKASKLFPEQQIAYYTIQVRMKMLIKFAEQYVIIGSAREKQVSLASHHESMSQHWNTKYLSVLAEQKASMAITSSKNVKDHDERVRSMVELVMKPEISKVDLYRKIVMRFPDTKINGAIVANIIKEELGLSTLEIESYSPLAEGPIPAE